MLRPDAKVEKVYLYHKPVDFRKSIEGLAALVELDINVAVFDSVLCKRPINPTELKMGCALSWAMSESNSTAAALRNLQPLSPSAGAAMHRAHGHWLWQS